MTFDSATIESLAERIDQQLATLTQTPPSSIKSGLEKPDSPLAKQATEIEKITKEKPVSFLKKFRKAAKADLCEEEGTLNAQWQQWKDLVSGDVVKNISPYLLAMGFSGTLLEALVVAVGVIVIHIGLKAFCEEFGE